MGVRGTVLLLHGRTAPVVSADYLRASGLLVHEANATEDAIRDFHIIAPDVIVTDFSPSAVRALRDRADPATSIIVVASLWDPEETGAAGADCFMVKPALPGEILYEVHRALILRRSGRRLPWSRQKAPHSDKLHH
jgi:DNA-binding response OmpR family regulator